MRRRMLWLVLLAGLVPACHQSGAAAPRVTLPYGHVAFEGVETAGQPSREQFEALPAAGYRTVVNLRPAGEPGNLEGEAQLVTQLGLRYVHIPVAGAEGLTRENVALLAKIIDGKANRPLLIHCGSANRAGALIALKAAWLDGKSPEDALALGRRAGMSRLEAHVQRMLRP